MKLDLETKQNHLALLSHEIQIKQANKEKIDSKIDKMLEQEKIII